MINDSIIQLAQARERLQIAKDCKARMLAAITETEDYQAVSAEIRQYEAEVQTATDTVKEEALNEYAARGSKKPHPAIGIRVTTEVRYNADAALRWAREHLAEAVTLDRRFFEAHAKAVAKTQPVPCVELELVPSATIATDLSEWLPVEEMDIDDVVAMFEVKYEVKE